MSVSGAEGGSNEDNEYVVKNLFHRHANPNHKITISGVYELLKKVRLLDEIVMTGLDLDELYNEFNVEFMNYEQFIQMLNTFSARKKIEMDLLMQYITQQGHIALDAANEDGTSEGSSTSISGRSDASNSYTYYPIGHPRHKCVDELASTDDEAEEGRKSDGDDDQLLATPSSSHSVIPAVPSMGQYEEDEYENREDAGLSGSEPQFEIPGILLPTQEEEAVPAVDRASKNMLTPARNS